MKTTRKHFEIFKAECKKWIDFYGLKDWEFEIRHEETGDNSIANHTFDLSQRFAIIRLATDWGDFKITDFELKNSAHHEVIESRFSRIRVLASTRFIRNEEIEEEIHSLVKIFHNVVFLVKGEF